MGGRRPGMARGCRQLSRAEPRVRVVYLVATGAAYIGPGEGAVQRKPAVQVKSRDHA
jgi:hypothetical protein